MRISKIYALAGLENINFCQKEVGYLMDINKH